jgi:hypothetical protein
MVELAFRAALVSRVRLPMQQRHARLAAIVIAVADPVVATNAHVEEPEALGASHFSEFCRRAHSSRRNRKLTAAEA